MPATVERASRSEVVNVPNLLTAARLVLSIVVFALIAAGAFLPALISFVVAASTDWVDGYWARKYGQVTKLGRMFDPFVDKIIICGTFIFLAAVPQSGLGAWMAVVVVGRELLVTALRSAVEGRGGDFSANMAGKLKMVFQCLAVVASLLFLRFGHRPEAQRFALLVPAAAWIAIVSTVYSGSLYVTAAMRQMSDSDRVA